MFPLEAEAEACLPEGLRQWLETRLEEIGQNPGPGSCQSMLLLRTMMLLRDMVLLRLWTFQLRISDLSGRENARFLDKLASLDEKVFRGQPLTENEPVVTLETWEAPRVFIHVQTCPDTVLLCPTYVLYFFLPEAVWSVASFLRGHGGLQMWLSHLMLL